MADGTVRERRGCLCMLFISDETGTRPQSYIACAEHRRMAEDNRVER